MPPSSHGRSRFRTPPGSSRSAPARSRARPGAATGAAMFPRAEGPGGGAAGACAAKAPAGCPRRARGGGSGPAQARRGPTLAGRAAPLGFALLLAPGSGSAQRPRGHCRADGLRWLVEGRGRRCHLCPKAGQGRDALENCRPGVVHPVIFTTAVPELTLRDVSEVSREISRRERKPEGPRPSLPRAWALGRRALCGRDYGKMLCARCLPPTQPLTSRPSS